MRRLSVSVLLAAILSGCAAAPPMPSPAAQSTAHANAVPGVRVGYLADAPLQHPVVSDHDVYLDLYENGTWRAQIVLVFAADQELPQDRSRALEVTGLVERLALHGARGTPAEYDNEVVYVTSWRWLDDGAVPRLAPADAP